MTSTVCHRALNRAATRATTRAFRQGTTLLELILVLAIVSIVATIAFPKVATLMDQIEVRSATSDAESLFALARHTAIARSSFTTVDIDTSGGTLTVHVGSDTVARRLLTAVHGVRLAASRTTTVYAPTGLGYGGANLTLILTKHAMADTLTLSRLGRIR